MGHLPSCCGVGTAGQVGVLVGPTESRRGERLRSAQVSPPGVVRGQWALVPALLPERPVTLEQVVLGAGVRAGDEESQR